MCYRSLKCALFTTSLLIAITSLILLIYGLVGWDTKQITKCIIVDYELQIDSCYAKYYTPSSINCSDPIDAFMDKSTCAILDLYKYKNNQIILPCLVSTTLNLQSCPSFENSLNFPPPYFNYLSTYTEAQICVIVGSTFFGCVCFLLLSYLIYKFHDYRNELKKLNKNVNTNYKSTA